MLIQSGAFRRIIKKILNVILHILYYKNDQTYCRTVKYIKVCIHVYLVLSPISTIHNYTL